MRMLFAVPAWLLATALAGAEMSTPPVLETPVACDVSAACSIQKYVDHDPGPGRADYACGRLSLDGDTGTDFRVANLPAMRAGVAVLAAADGVVRAARDGMEDVSVRDIGADAIKGREAGNAVAIRHGGGWETQYSHLKKGSVRVKPGDAVKTGDVLGEIGLSGNTEFPHVEFTVRHNGNAVDPFVGLAAFDRCGDARAPLWSQDAIEKLPYRPVVLLSSGFAGGPADAEDARRGDYAAFILTRETDALVFWADVSGALAGDRERASLIAPDGVQLATLDRVLDENNISWFVFAGARRPADGWDAGTYEARYALSRNGETVAETVRKITLRH
ncbi:MAG: M23 family metallopeptidase [Hyphococcus sp.]